MDLGERERAKRDVPVATLPKALHHRLVGVAGKWAQIIEGNFKSYTRANVLSGSIFLQSAFG